MIKKDTEFSESKKEKGERIDIMLHDLMTKKVHEWLYTGEEPEHMTLAEIADHCGCDHMIIYRTQERALAKLKSKLLKMGVK